MKKFIKKLLRENLDVLNEALVNLDDDVDFIFDKYFEKDYSEISNTGKLTPYMFKSKYLKTSDLNSPEAKKANKLNPCKIFINIYDNNFYNPNEKIISLSVNKSAVNFIKDNENDLFLASDYFLNNGDYGKARRILKEFDESTIKGSIHHELVHWIDDTMNNYHLKHTINKRLTEPKKDDINKHYLEIQSQIHNIYQLKRKYAKQWDLLTFNDLFLLSPALHSAYNDFSPSDRLEWVKNIKKRMWREGLLGKNMVK